jgi:hypothetical protein
MGPYDRIRRRLTVVPRCTAALALLLLAPAGSSAPNPAPAAPAPAPRVVGYFAGWTTAKGYRV